MSAQLIFDHAPLGALIRFTDGDPRPPARFKRKLAAWEHTNGTGRLTTKSPASQHGSHAMPASFALHMGNYGSNGVTILTVTQHFSVNSGLTFEIVEAPKPGQVRVLHDLGSTVELLHLADDHASAQRWLDGHGYRGAWLEEVTGEHAESSLGQGRAVA